MEYTKSKNGKRLIPMSMFEICHIDGLTRKQIAKRYKKEDVTKHKSIFFLEKFNHHLKITAKMDIKEYCKKYFHVNWPRCPINNEEVGYNLTGEGLVLSDFVATVTRQFSPNFDKACKKMSEDRKGDGNPMFGLDPWNKGLTKETNESLRLVSEKQTGRIVSQETREKHKEARRIHPLKARHNKPHCPETVEKMRIITAERIANGSFCRGPSSIHIKIREFLKTLNLKQNWSEEFQVKYFSLDFAFPEVKVGIECQGSYFHVDPRLYPNGPISAVQRRNFGRDIAKKKFLCDQNNWTIIEVWEPEINDGTFKEYLINKLKKLNLIWE